MTGVSTLVAGFWGWSKRPQRKALRDLHVGAIYQPNTEELLHFNTEYQSCVHGREGRKDFRVR